MKLGRVLLPVVAVVAVVSAMAVFQVDVEVEGLQDAPPKNAPAPANQLLSGPGEPPTPLPTRSNPARRPSRPGPVRTPRSVGSRVADPGLTPEQRELALQAELQSEAEAQRAMYETEIRVLREAAEAAAAAGDFAEAEQLQEAAADMEARRAEEAANWD